MNKSNSISAAVCAAFIVTSGPAAAGNDLLKIGAGVALGVGIAKAIEHNKKKKGSQKATSRSSSQSSGISSAQRQQNREVQTALNTFGFPVGGVDGKLGSRSRSAISNYQSYMGYPPTGHLDDYQRGRLVDSMYRYNSGGGNAYPNVVANEGTRGLLKAFNDPNYANRYGGQDNYNGQNNGVNNNDYANSQNRVVEPEYNDTGLDDSFEPLDLSLGQTSNSMATHCELVAGLTQANQGVVLASSISDPEQALGEQFCEARAFAITESQSIMSTARATPEKLNEQCAKIADKMVPAFSGIGTQGVKVVAAEAQEISDRIFKGNVEAATSYGKICLGLGYRQDDATMALGGATVLLTTGQIPYSEIMGHHLRWGFGVGRSPVASIDWYDTALSAMEQGAQPVFLPSKTGERNAIIRAAIDAPIGGVVPVQAAENDSDALPELSFD